MSRTYYILSNFNVNNQVNINTYMGESPILAKFWYIWIWMLKIQYINFFYKNFILITNFINIFIFKILFDHFVLKNLNKIIKKALPIENFTKTSKKNSYIKKYSKSNKLGIYIRVVPNKKTSRFKNTKYHSLLIRFKRKNLFLTLLNPKGNVLCKTTIGSCGFKKKVKYTGYAIKRTSKRFSKKLLGSFMRSFKKTIRHCRIMLKNWAIKYKPFTINYNKSALKRDEENSTLYRFKLRTNVKMKHFVAHNFKQRVFANATINKPSKELLIKMHYAYDNILYNECQFGTTIKNEKYFKSNWNSTDTENKFELDALTTVDYLVGLSQNQMYNKFDKDQNISTKIIYPKIMEEPTSVINGNCYELVENKIIKIIKNSKLGMNYIEIEKEQNKWACTEKINRNVLQKKKLRISAKIKEVRYILKNHFKVNLLVKSSFKFWGVGFVMYGLDRRFRWFNNLNTSLPVPHSKGLRLKKKRII